MKLARILTILMPFGAIAAIAGCSASPTSAPHSGAGTVPFEKASWVSPSARHGDLLYISNIGDASVTIYSWPKGELVGSLSGFFVEPEGLCSDNDGNVFITDDYLAETLEFAHGSSTLNQTLTDPGYVPNGCAVNPASGDLAVANKIGPTRRSSRLGRGSVAIYKNASGTPINFVSHDVYSEYFCGYDANGDLFVDGYSANARHARFAELPNGSGSLHTLKLNRHIDYVGGVQWDGQYLAIGDVHRIRRFSIAADRGTEAGSTPLRGATPVEQFTIQGSRVVGPDEVNAVIWSYPTGGSPIKVLTQDLDFPVGSAISVAPKH